MSSSKFSKKRFQNKLLHFFASIKFAIPVLLVFAFAMILGTIAESRYGTDYAQRMIYHTWWFYLIQGLIALSVSLSFMDRLPFRKKLSGFYMIHIGLIIILIGAVVTRVWGIDGQLELAPERNAQLIQLNEDYLYLFDGQNQLQVALPFAASSVTLNQMIKLPTDEKLTLRQYHPFARAKRTWKEAEGVWHARWRLDNANMSQSFEFWTGVTTPVVTHNFGPLHIELIPRELLLAYTSALMKKDSRFLVYHQSTGQVVQLREQDRSTSFTVGGETYTFAVHLNKKLGLTAYQLKKRGETFVFFPRYSHFPVTQRLQLNKQSPCLFFDLSLVRQRPTLFFARADQEHMTILYGKDTQWTQRSDQEAIVLPWMGFTLRKETEFINRVPHWVYEQAVPNKKENVRALLLDVEGEEVWVSNQTMTEFSLSGKPYKTYVGVKLERLPFQMKLKEFKIETIPGTTKPASYESFVHV